MCYCCYSHGNYRILGYNPNTKFTEWRMQQPDRTYFIRPFHLSIPPVELFDIRWYLSPHHSSFLLFAPLATDCECKRACVRKQMQNVCAQCTHGGEGRKAECNWPRMQGETHQRMEWRREANQKIIAALSSIKMHIRFSFNICTMYICRYVPYVCYRVHCVHTSVDRGGRAIATGNGVTCAYNTVE